MRHVDVNGLNELRRKKSQEEISKEREMIIESNISSLERKLNWLINSKSEFMSQTAQQYVGNHTTNMMKEYSYRKELESTMMELDYYKNLKLMKMQQVAYHIYDNRKFAI